jgi:hypothetical protein
MYLLIHGWVKSNIKYGRDEVRSLRRCVSQLPEAGRSDHGATFCRRSGFSEIKWEKWGNIFLTNYFYQSREKKGSSMTSMGPIA